MNIISQNRKNRFFFYCAGTLILLGLVTPLTATEEDLGLEARHLYEDGQYAQARQLLERLDSMGQADGPQLYRLYYCQQLAGDPASAETLNRSRTSLEREHADGVSLEATFYLANVYSNVGRLSDARRIAAEATQRLEAGSWTDQASGNARFMAGKLYADQDQVEKAIEWYKSVVDSPEGTLPASSAYVEWASQYIVDRALDQQNFALAEQFAAVLLETGEKSFDSLDQLAVLKSRVGQHAEAADLWRQAIPLDPSRANRGRYLQNISIQAVSAGTLPTSTPEDRAWRDLSREELETLMIDQANIVGEVNASVKDATKIKRKQRKLLQARLDAARPVFLRAVLEYGYRGLPVRETAFQAGFANLIFKERHWRLPEKE